MFVIIVGGGKVGNLSRHLLLNDKQRVKVIEQRREEIARLQRDLPPDAVVLGSGTDRWCSNRWACARPT
jgi:Trk K+ transport system NAD-binding subunit